MSNTEASSSPKNSASRGNHSGIVGNPGGSTEHDCQASQRGSSRGVLSTNMKIKVTGNGPNMSPAGAHDMAASNESRTSAIHYSSEKINGYSQDCGAHSTNGYDYRYQEGFMKSADGHSQGIETSSPEESQSYKKAPSRHGSRSSGRSSQGFLNQQEGESPHISTSTAKSSGNGRQTQTCMSSGYGSKSMVASAEINGCGQDAEEVVSAQKSGKNGAEVEALLLCYIYDYFLKKGYTKLTQVMGQNMDTNFINKNIINTQKSYLLEWWGNLCISTQKNGGNANSASRSRSFSGSIDGSKSIGCSCQKMNCSECTKFNEAEIGSFSPSGTAYNGSPAAGSRQIDDGSHGHPKKNEIGAEASKGNAGVMYGRNGFSTEKKSSPDQEVFELSGSSQNEYNIQMAENRQFYASPDNSTTNSHTVMQGKNGMPYNHAAQVQHQMQQANSMQNMQHPKAQYALHQMAIHGQLYQRKQYMGNQQATMHGAQRGGPMMQTAYTAQMQQGGMSQQYTIPRQMATNGGMGHYDWQMQMSLMQQQQKMKRYAQVNGNIPQQPVDGGSRQRRHVPNTYAQQMAMYMPQGNYGASPYVATMQGNGYSAQYGGSQPSPTIQAAVVHNQQQMAQMANAGCYGHTEFKSNSNAHTGNMQIPNGSQANGYPMQGYSLHAVYSPSRPGAMPMYVDDQRNCEVQNPKMPARQMDKFSQDEYNMSSSCERASSEGSAHPSPRDEKNEPLPPSSNVSPNSASTFEPPQQVQDSSNININANEKIAQQNVPNMTGEMPDNGSKQANNTQGQDLSSQDDNYGGKNNGYDRPQEVYYFTNMDELNDSNDLLMPNGNHEHKVDAKTLISYVCDEVKNKEASSSFKSDSLIFDELDGILEQNSDILSNSFIDLSSEISTDDNNAMSILNMERVEICEYDDAPTSNAASHVTENSVKKCPTPFKPDSGPTTKFSTNLHSIHMQYNGSNDMIQLDMFDLSQ